MNAVEVMRRWSRLFIAAVVTSQVVMLVCYLNSITSSNRPSDSPVKRMLGETLDYSGEYRVVRFYRYEGIPRNYNFSDVTIATQCSVNHLHHLVELLDRWDGPVSCSVFVPNQDASYASDAITLLRSCFPKIRRNVAFHFAYPSAHPADLSHKGTWSGLACAELAERLRKYGYHNYEVGGLAFPHNVLRNVARTGVLTDYVLLVDIDVMPSVGLRTDFLSFARAHDLFREEGDLTAYVLPVFEVKQGLDFPRNKTELLRGVADGSVRPFHNETCWWCHRAENFDKWKAFPQVPGSLEVAFESEWDKSWEPFYIARRTVPMFDERFKQYGFDRIQQICEMHVAGWRFAVLDGAFLTHHGWKIAGEFYDKKETDNAQNWILFNYHFKDELPLKYNTNRSCSQAPDHINKQRVTAALGRGGAIVNSRFNPAPGARLANHIVGRASKQTYL